MQREQLNKNKERSDSCKIGQRLLIVSGKNPGVRNHNSLYTIKIYQVSNIRFTYEFR